MLCSGHGRISTTVVARFDERVLRHRRVAVLGPEPSAVPVNLSMSDPEGTVNGDVGSDTVKGGRMQPQKLHSDRNTGEPGHGPVGDAQHKSAAGRPGLALVGVIASVPVSVLTVLVLLVSGRPLGETLLVALGLQLATSVLVISACMWRADSDARSGPPDGTDGAATAARASEHLGTWHSYVGEPDEATQPLRIGLAARNSVQGRSIATNLAGFGHEAHLVSDLDSLLGTVADRPKDWDCIIADLDVVGDTETAVDELLIFRDSCPVVPVLLLSSEVRRDDLSRTRCAIGDATLRKPVFRQGLLEGMSAALENAPPSKVRSALSEERQDSLYK